MTGPDILDGPGADGLFLHMLQKLTGEIEAYVGFEEDPADLPKSFAHRIFREHATPGELLERGAELSGQLVEHSL